MVRKFLFVTLSEVYVVMVQCTHVSAKFHTLLKSKRSSDWTRSVSMKRKGVFDWIIMLKTGLFLSQ